MKAAQGNLPCSTRIAALVCIELIMASLAVLVTAQDTGLQRALKADQRRAEVIARASAASICVFSSDGNGGGSGVIVTPDGYALTNYHVVKPCGSHMHCSLPDGTLYDAVVVGMDPTGDVALIRLLGRNDFPVAEWGDSDALRVGDPCFAVGNPFLLATNFEPSVSWGIVSGVHRYQYPDKTLLEYTDCIQTDAAINPGNSGGPLFNGHGQLVGINGRGSFEKRGRVNVGVGYAISINQIKMFRDHLRSGRICDHATLGAIVSSDDQGNVVVDEVLQSSDAWRRGLRYGDQIVAFGGRSIETVNEFKNVLGIYPKGWRLPLEYRRNGVSRTIQVRLSGLHSLTELTERLAGGEKPRQAPEQPSSPNDGIPEVAKKMIEIRPGFSNYYFNRIIQEDILAACRASGDAGVFTGNKWRISCQTNGGSKIRMVLGEDQSGIQWGDSAAILDPASDLASQLVPDGSGGLLVAAQVWQRFLASGPESFGEVFYLGALPRRNLVTANVLVARFETLEARFFFDRESGRLVEMELWSDPDRDPCEIEFEDFRNVGGVELPHRWNARHGDFFNWEINIESFELRESGE